MTVYIAAADQMPAERIMEMMGNLFQSSAGPGHYSLRRYKAFAGIQAEGEVAVMDSHDKPGLFRLV